MKSRVMTAVLAAIPSSRSGAFGRCAARPALMVVLTFLCGAACAEPLAGDVVGCTDKAAATRLLALEDTDAAFVGIWAKGMQDGSCRGYSAGQEVTVDERGDGMACVRAADDKACFWVEDAASKAGSAPFAVEVARATVIPACTRFVDAAAAQGGSGTAQQPHRTIAAAIDAAEPGAVICVAEGVYREQLRPGDKPLTLAGGFRSGAGFSVRDSASHVSKAEGDGSGSFLLIEDPGPEGEALTAIDGFEIAGYAQAIVRDLWYSQRFEITNNFVHHNVCTDLSLAGAGFALNNVSGVIRGNVFADNSCGRGGAGFLNDDTNANSVLIEGNRFERNQGAEPDSAHGGGLYLFVNDLTIRGNSFIGNAVAQWGGGLFVGAYTPGGQFTTARLAWNVYRGNRAGNSGGGFFCDDGAACFSDHEVYEGNCGANIMVDGGAAGSGPTVARFDHLTNVGAREAGCEAPGTGILVGTYEGVAADSYSVANAIFWDNAPGRDIATACGSGCAAITVEVARSMVQTDHGDGSIAVTFEGIVASVDPLFVDARRGDFRLRSDSPLAGTELGAHGGAAASDSAAGEVAPPRTAGPGVPAVARGGDYMGFAERFNRYYTDRAWQPSQTLHVSPDGGGDGAAPETAMTAGEAIAAARPGTLIRFGRGEYQGCFGFTGQTGGTYDQPVVLHGERNEDGSPGVSIRCCGSGRQACFNFEAADYIAVDGFELLGGEYGVRAVGAGYPASLHSRGIAVMNSRGHGQDRDPFFSGQVDWAVWEGNLATGAKEGDGHGFYLSNGGDWNIVRFNETHGNVSSDLQINPDPASTCEAEGIAFDDPRCDAHAGEGEGGQGASDYFLVEGNYFHHGLGPGPNFTSVRRSVIRNNVFGPQARHNVSFWQETDNPKLGSSDNRIVHNLFITTGRHGVQFASGSTRNDFANNVLLGVALRGGAVAANPDALLMEAGDTAPGNIFRSNLYVSGRIEGRVPADGETALEDFSTGWFARFPVAIEDDPDGFAPTPAAPFLGMGQLSPAAPFDRNGVRRGGSVDLGPIELSRPR